MTWPVPVDKSLAYRKTLDMLRYFTLLASLAILSGCAASTQPELPETVKAKAELQDASINWFYGPGVGRTLSNVGLTAFFPPYGIYLLGNAGLTLAGAEPVYPSQLLPTGVREPVESVYDNVTSVPGRFNAAAAGIDYRKRMPVTPQDS